MTRRTLLTAFVCTAAACALLAQEKPPAGTRYAFLIACSGYQKTQLRPLPYTINDIEEFKKALLETGFDDDNIVVMHDRLPQGRFHPEAGKIRDELAKFLKGMKEHDTLVVALSGHGVHYKGDAAGYFCPVNARLDDKRTLLPLDGDDGLFELLHRCKARQKLLLVNACRNDPASDLAQAAEKVNLEDAYPERVPEGIAAIYSCQKGEKSYYDDERKRGIFFVHAAAAWRGAYQKPDDGPLTLERFFEQVRVKTRADVYKNLGEAQNPDVRRQYDGVWLVNDRRRERDIGRTTTEPREWPLGMRFVRLPKGTFYMGGGGGKASTKTEIKEDFWIAAHTVTQGQWQDLMGDNPSKHSRKGEYANNVRAISDADLRQFPVESVSWEDAQRFIAKLNERERGLGWLYRLPSEAEWEYGCRGGATSEEECSYDFYLSRPTNDLSSDQANFNGNSPAGNAPKGRFLQRPTKVGSYPANKLGLYDMHGNVWQWCADLYESGGSDRVVRGGSWGSDASSCRAFARRRRAPSLRDYALGFRLAAVPVR